MINETGNGFKKFLILIVVFVISVLVIVGVIIIGNQNSLRKNLMNNTWWEETSVYNEYYGYRDEYREKSNAIGNFFGSLL